MRALARRTGERKTQPFFSADGRIVVLFNGVRLLARIISYFIVLFIFLLYSMVLDFIVLYHILFYCTLF